MNSSTEALNGNNGNNSSSSVHSRSSQVTAPCQTPEKVEHPDLAHTCPSLSSIQLLNEVGKGEKSNGSSLVDMVSNAKTDERGDHSFSSFIDVGSSGLDLFTQRHSDSSEEPRSTKSIKRETSPASDMVRLHVAMRQMRVHSLCYFYWSLTVYVVIGESHNHLFQKLQWFRIKERCRLICLFRI